jgi:hypothetical protein
VRRRRQAAAFSSRAGTAAPGSWLFLRSAPRPPRGAADFPQGALRRFLLCAPTLPPLQRAWLRAARRGAQGSPLKRSLAKFSPARSKAQCLERRLRSVLLSARLVTEAALRLGLVECLVPGERVELAASSAGGMWFEASWPVDQPVGPWKLVKARAIEQCVCVRHADTPRPLAKPGQRP